MKKLFRILSAFMTAALFISNMQFADITAFAEEEIPTYDVTDFGADGSDTADDTKAITKALVKAKTAESGIIVYIPSGTYYISSALTIFSNTTLRLADDATIVSTNSSIGVMLVGKHLKEDGSVCRSSDGYECSHGGYSQLQNVVIEGGTWDGGFGTTPKSLSIFILRHSYNITVRNTTLKRASDHFINLSSSNTTLVENVTFMNAVHNVSRTASDETIEAVHYDEASANNETGAKPLDNTAPCHGTVQNCTFTNCNSCAGCHHTGNVNKGYDFDFINNTATGLNGYAFFCEDFLDAVVSGNNVSGGQGLLMAREAEVTVTKNTVADGANYGIDVQNTSADITISSNRVTGSGVNGIHAENITGKTSILSNKVGTSGNMGIYTKLCPQLVVAGNTVKTAGTHGFLCEECESVTVYKNTITRSVYSAIRFNGSSAHRITAKVQGNTASTKTDADYAIYFGKFCSGCFSAGNTMSSTGVGIYYTSNCTTKLAAPTADFKSGTSGIKITWSEVPFATGYRVYRKKSGESSWTKIATQSGTSYTDTKAKTGYLYYYIVRAYSKVGSSVLWSSYKSFKAIRLKTPVISSQTASEGKITLTWSGAGGSTGYAVYRRKGSSGSWKRIAITSEKSYSDTKVSAGVTYYYTVKAYSKKADKTVWSSYKIGTGITAK